MFSGQKGRPLLNKDNPLVSGPGTHLSEFKCCMNILIMPVSLCDHGFVLYTVSLHPLQDKRTKLQVSPVSTPPHSPLCSSILFISNLYHFWNILNLDLFHAENDSWYEAYFGAVCWKASLLAGVVFRKMSLVRCPWLVLCFADFESFKWSRGFLKTHVHRLN